jgi:RNA polymerase sigma-70 factor (family 1)
MKNIFNFFQSKTYLTDDDLVTGLVRGESMAFESIYKKYSFKLFRIAFNQLGSQEDAEELVQELFANLWKRREKLSIKNLNLYLVISIKNKVYDAISSRINFRKYQEYTILREIHESYETSEIISYNELNEAVDQILDQMPEKTADVFRRSRFEKQSVREIAEALALSEKAVEYHISKSLKLFREKLTDFKSSN